ncbi:transposase [Pontiellaceae bacterium B12227]|nr:transposase [Pontiellaceae bacterium B12227]
MIIFMSNPQQPRRQRRLDRIFDSAPAYYLTLCTEGRKRVLANDVVMERVRGFVDESVQRYGVYVDCLGLMPDHAHMIVTIDPTSNTTLGKWIKAFKAVVARREFKWQAGYFDHVLRSAESRSEKWDYIRMNPVRAGLVSDANEWTYAQWFNRFDGSEL